MTPLARRIMEKVRQKDHGTYERWFQAIVDATLAEAGLPMSDAYLTDKEIIAKLQKPQRKVRT